MGEVVVVGDANVDIIVPFPRFIDESRTRTTWEQPQMQGGGTCANTAVALSRLDVPVLFVGTVGDDQYGRYVRRDFSEAGVDPTGLVSDSRWNTVGVFAFVDERGERYLWGWPREKQSFKELDVSMIPMHRIRAASWVHASGMVMAYDTSAREALIHVFEEAHAAGVPTSFDLNLRILDGKLDPAMREALDRLMPNVNYLLGSGPDEFSYMGDHADWEENAADFAVDGRIVIVRDGARGARALQGKQCYKASAFSVEVEDTLGAGDVFNAGFIMAMLHQMTLPEALTISNAVSAYTVERKGSRSSPDKQQLMTFLKAHNASAFIHNQDNIKE
ncbi:carbohydrate kinase family protein [Bifidobacterium cebidarum]|uniref:Carbohydrate kinase n=1 Tax=Bifidobacterium cebidarum TaxID=2650773 RepID=A0A6I1GRE9_9BIFI|nr:carbohydrate kinase family protein [Bifidobacterium cebidarum]KAB7789121.1 carbohydrate kinase [Bifidobacterium cebidarum]